VESPSARRRLGVGAALSGLLAAGGCFCAALLLALLADSDREPAYARTLASPPGACRVTAAPAGATVGLTLRAADRGACGKTVVRRFAVTWHLARTDAGWRATAAAARLLTGAARVAAC
jgi:hypothetical protein